MPDFNPVVLRRMLFLRQCSLFAAADLDELATIAENVVSTTYPAGTIVAPTGSTLAAVRFVVDGKIEVGDVRWGPRQVFGAIEVAASRRLPSPAIASLPTEAFELSSPDFRDVLEDNFGVLVSVLRDLSRRVLALGSPSIRRQRTMPAIHTLGLVERLLVLRQVLPFARTRVQALARLAHDSEEVHFPVGVVLPDHEPATGGFVIVEGSVRTVDPAVRELGPGDSLGYIETLANRPPARTWMTSTGVRALRTSGAAMLDVLEDHTDVGLALVSAFSSALLDSATPAIVAPEFGANANDAGTSMRTIDIARARDLLRLRS